MRHRVVMIATSYPRFPGDNVGSFMEPIAKGVAGRGHDVHLVAPWHPLVARASIEDGVTFHFFRYAPLRALNVFGYAAAMRADVELRAAAWLAAPLAMVSGWRMARRVAAAIDATVMHGHWVVPGGALALAAAGPRPLVVSLHGSDVYVAERHAAVGRIARRVFERAGWVTACSDDLRRRAIALGARASASEVVPYGVDTGRFRPDSAARARLRTSLGVGPDAAVIFSAGRFVAKKGFDYLIDAFARLAPERPDARLVIGGGGDLEERYVARAAALGVADRLHLPGLLLQDEVSAWLAAASVAVVPSIRDDGGNVDGLPNVLLEAMASGTPLVTTAAGGIGAVVSNGENALVVPERDAPGLAAAIEAVLADPARARALGTAARLDVETRRGWPAVAERLEQAYDRAVAATSVV